MKNLKTYFNMVITAVVCLLSAGIVKMEDVLLKEKRAVKGTLAGKGLNGTMLVGVLMSGCVLCREMVAGKMLPENVVAVFTLLERNGFKKVYRRKKLPRIQMAVCRGSPWNQKLFSIPEGADSIAAERSLVSNQSLFICQN